MALGGRAAEAIVFKRISTGEYGCYGDSPIAFSTPGAEDDLRRVTEMAQRQVMYVIKFIVYVIPPQVAEYGMSPIIGHISVQPPRSGPYEVRPYSDHLTRLIDQVSYCLH